MPSPISARGWLADQLRLSAFFSEPTAAIPIAASSWFEKCVGFAADEESRQRGTNYQATGRQDEVRVDLSVEPFRTDWRISAHVEPNGPPEKWLAIDFDRALELFRMITRNFPADYISAKRLAVGMILVQPCAGYPEGMKTLADYLPGVSIKSDLARDFIYQVNIPTTSTVLPELLLNRVTKWSVGSQQRVALLLPPQSAGSSAAVTVPLYAARLEVDMNTDGTRAEALPSALTGAIVEELVGLVSPIATEGMS